MIKIFLVEDEVIIRNGIKKSVDWIAHGYDFAGEASDGELAWPMIKEKKPDILITDIRMPFMDGLELSELVKKELPLTKIIILSGYEEFDYAKKAIKIGVTEYLLKPISSEKLLEAIDRIADIIKEEQEEKKLLEQYAREMQENTEKDKYDFFNSLLDGRMSMTDALEQGNKLGIDLGAEGYCVVLYKIMTPEHRMVYTDELVKTQERIEAFAEKTEKVLWYRRGVEGWAFIIQGKIGNELCERVSSFMECIQKISKEYENLEYFGGIGQQVERIRMLKESYNTAYQAFANRFVKMMNQVITYDEIVSSVEKDSIEYQNLGSMGENRKLLETFLRSGTEEEIPSFISVYFEALHEDDLQSFMLRQYIVMDAFVCFFSVSEKLNISREELQTEIGDIHAIGKHIESVQSTKKCLESTIRKMIMLRDKASNCRYSDILRRAKRYTDENYMSEEISLNTVAACVNMSPSYFSSVFSQESGQTYIEYLTSVRIQKAKELLECSNMRISDISYEVGYKDPHYFSYIFKKTQGCSPKEFRSKSKA